MNVKMRQRVERSIVRRLVLDALAAGYTVRVDDGEEHLTPTSQTAKAVLALMFTVDEEYLIFTKDEVNGWAALVYGNDGPDVISDYSLNVEHLMAGANALADKYS